MLFRSLWIDILGHQIPLFILYKQRKQITKRCGIYISVPLAMYTLSNYVNDTPMSKTYGVPTPYLYLVGYGIISSLGNLYHINKNTNI